MIYYQEKAPLFISIIPSIVDGQGHIIPYHDSISEALEILNWQHQVAYSSSEKVKGLPSNWLDCLGNSDLEKDVSFWGNFNKYQDVIKLSKTINSYLTKVINSDRDQAIIIFIERFIHLQLLALYLSLLNLDIKQDNLFIWVLYRRDFHKHKTRFIYKWLNQSLKGLVKPNHFQLFSDSQLLANSMSKYFEESMIVMPIPHTEFIDKTSINNQDHKILCWWPGPPREEKGWQIMRQLTKCQTNLADKFTLVAARESKLNSSPDGVRVILTNNHLNRSEYVDSLSKADIILLPYDAVAYQERTSGIFTESIIAGNIPVTTAKTWMAQELLQFNLDELIIDWQEVENIFPRLDQILRSPEVQRKLEIMRQEYRNFHNLNNFANQFKNCYHQAH